jgi:outer membrane biosynthesis protein TonB
MSTIRSKDRVRLCSFTFADGRQCRTPRRSGHPHFCFFHAQKEEQSCAAVQAGKDISSHLSGFYLSACDLSSALARLFSAVAQGEIKPKTASTLAYLGQTLLQAIPLAQHEFINAFSTDAWRKTVRTSIVSPDELPARPPRPHPAPPPKPALQRTPRLQPVPHPAPPSQPHPVPVSQEAPTPQSAPAPHAVPARPASPGPK